MKLMNWKTTCGMLATVLIISMVFTAVFPVGARETVPPDGTVTVPVKEGAPSSSPRFYTSTVYFQSWVSDVRVVGFSIDAEDRVSVSLRYMGTGTSPAVTVVVTTEGMPIYVPMNGYGYVEETGMPVPLPAADETANETKEGYRQPESYPYPVPPPYPYPYPYLIGSGVIKEGWSSPGTLTLGLVGDGSLYDATYLQVLLIPYTGKWT